MYRETFYNFHPNIKAVVVKNIRKYRKIRGYTQEQLAFLSEISYDFMRRIESGKGEIGFSIQTLYKLKTALDVSYDNLFEEEK